MNFDRKKLFHLKIEFVFLYPNLVLSERNEKNNYFVRFTELFKIVNENFPGNLFFFIVQRNKGRRIYVF